MDWLRFTLPAFVYSVGLSPVIAAAVRTSLAIIGEESWRVERLQQNSRHFLAAAKARRLNTGGAVGAGVITLQFHTPEECMQAAGTLLRAGYYAPPIAQIGVPKDKPRIRFFISASHGPDEMTDALDQLGEERHQSTSAEAVLRVGA